MDINFNAFKEPRGAMRVIHFIFSICAFASITSYSGYINFKCASSYSYYFDYPFYLTLNQTLPDNCTISTIGNFSSDAKFFVATGVLSMLYAVAISIFYLKFDAMYKTNNQLPLIDFVLTVIFGVLWLSSSAAWANGLSGLKYAIDAENIQTLNCNPKCQISTSNFSSLNISVIFGFLNFFLWAADLWFLYKETTWFQGNQQQEATSGV